MTIVGGWSVFLCGEGVRDKPTSVLFCLPQILCEAHGTEPSAVL